MLSKEKEILKLETDGASGGNSKKKEQ